MSVARRLGGRTNKGNARVPNVASMSSAVSRIATGSDALDGALGGGVPCGFTLLVEGPQGVGSTEFAFTLLRALHRSRPEGKAVFLSALRNPARIAREVNDLFDDTQAATRLRIQTLASKDLTGDWAKAVHGLSRGDCIVVESISALARAKPDLDLAAFVQSVANLASEVGVVVVLLHAPGTVPPSVEASVHEAVDAVFTFQWRDGGQSRRRLLTITKLRGLGPGLHGEQVPIFEAALQIGTGFAVSRVQSVM